MQTSTRANADSKKKKIDMTQGPIMKNVLLFALPIIIGNILQQMYTTVDTLVVGNFCDSTALAAMGTSAQPVEVLLCIFLGIGTGISILVSQYTGAGNMEGLRDICSTAVSFIFLCSLPLMIVGYFLSPALMRLMGVPADAFSSAVFYTQILFLGTLGNLGYNMNAGILRGMGDSNASLRFLIVSCISNIILDLLLVPGLGMGVRGAALSTILSQFLSWIVSIYYIRNRFPELSYSFLPKKIVSAELKKIISIGLPIGLNNSLFALGHMMMQTLVNANGSTFMAGAAVAGRVTNLTNIAITGLSSAATTFSGQNFGAKNFDRLRKGYIKIPAISGAITLTFGLAMISFRMPILRLFSKEEVVLMYASRYVIAMLLSQWCYAVFNGISCIVNGVGRIKYTTCANLLMVWGVRIPAAFIISKFFDGTFIMVCFPISFCFGMLCMIGYYLFCRSWKELMQTPNGVDVM